MKRLTANDISLVHGLPPVLSKHDMCSFDTEWFEMQKDRLHRPHGRFASMACTIDGHTVYYITDEKLIPEFMERISPALWTGHNLAFDIRQLRMFTDILPRKRIWDSMLVEQIRFRGYYDDFGLNDLARRYLGVYLDKSQQRLFEFFGDLSDEQVVYGALDVAAQWMIAQKQREQIDEQDLWIWQNIERPFMWLLLDIKGIKLDVNKWMKIAAEKGDAASKIWQECYDDYGINIRSPKQLLQFLNEHRINSTNVATLTANINKHPIIQKVLDYRKPAKGSSTYGASWVDDYVEDDGLVYASWNQMGARSGRMSCSSPNLQNIPVRTDPIYRECFVAEDGEQLIISDWSSQEPRITAFFSQDEKLIAIFRSGDDIYCSVGYHIFGEKFDKKDPRRKDMKALVLGLTYGMTKYGLAEKISVPEGKNAIDYAQFLIDTFMQEFPGVKKYIQDKIKQARQFGYVTTIYGRKCWISPYERGLERDACNYGVQGSAADAMKLAAIQIGAKYVRMFIHDELVCSAPKQEVNAVVTLINDIMVSVAEQMHPGVPSAVSIGVGSAWSAKE